MKSNEIEINKDKHAITGKLITDKNQLTGILVSQLVIINKPNNTWRSHTILCG